MKLENISLALRPRGAYEATDLGVRLLQRNATAVYTVWLVYVLPFMLLMISVHSVAVWLPSVLIWWFKPLYDRVVLFVLSRAVFGERVSVADVALNWRVWLSPGLFGALTWRRLEFTRAFSLPIYVLERLTWKKRRQRSKVLQKNTRTQAIVTQTAYVHLEVAIELSAMALLIVMLPAYANLPVWSWIIGQEVPAAWNIANNLCVIIGISIVEPAFVAAGFALYLNRRVELEAWDIELNLRRAVEDNEKSTLQLDRGTQPV
ncbi:MAG: hypothetical protein ABI583_08555 [Betaproteobacteria bacterium]